MKKLFVICALSALSTIAQGAAKEDSEVRKVLIHSLGSEGYFGRARIGRELNTAARLMALTDLRRAVDADDLVAAKWVSIGLRAFSSTPKFDSGKYVEGLFNKDKWNNEVKPALVELGFPADKL